MLKDRLGVANGQVLRQSDARAGVAQQAGQCFTANIQRLAFEILAVQLLQIEGVEKSIARAHATDRSAQAIEVRHAIRPAHYGLIVEGHALDRSLQREPVTYA